MASMLSFIYWLLLSVFLRFTHWNMNHHLPLLSCQVMSYCVGMLFCDVLLCGPAVLFTILF